VIILNTPFTNDIEKPSMSLPFLCNDCKNKESFIEPEEKSTFCKKI
jgi:hypothetical protein